MKNDSYCIQCNTCSLCVQLVSLPPSASLLRIYIAHTGSCTMPEWHSPDGGLHFPWWRFCSRSIYWWSNCHVQHCIRPFSENCSCKSGTEFLLYYSSHFWVSGQTLSLPSHHSLQGNSHQILLSEMSLPGVEVLIEKFLPKIVGGLGKEKPSKRRCKVAFVQRKSAVTSQVSVRCPCATYN